MKHYISLIIICFLHLSLFSQEWEWVRQINGQQNDSSHSIDVDDSGYVYIAGRSKVAIIFEDDTNPIGPIWHGDRDAFVSKYSPDGELIWATIGGSHLFGYDIAHGVKADNNGGCYISGFCIDSSAFGNDTVYSAGGRDVFVSHLNSDGTFDWTKSYGGVGQDNAYGVEVDQSGNVLFCGRIHGVVSFDGNNIGNTGQYNAFVAKMDPSGNLIEVHNFDSGYSSVLRQIVVDKYDNYYLCGGLHSSANFNGTLLSGANSPSWSDAVLIKCDNNFNVEWYETGGGSYLDLGYDIAVSDSSVYMSGVYSVTATFDTIVSTYNSVVTGAGSVSTSDLFVASYNLNGGIKWLVTGGNEGLDEAWGVATSPNDNVYVSGFFKDSISIQDTTLFSAPGTSNALVFRLNKDGGLVWAKETGNSANERAKELEIDQYENIYTCGDFYDPLSFDGIFHTPTHRDGFGGKITQHTYPEWAVLNTPICKGDTMILEMSGLTNPIQYEYIQLDGNLSWVDSNLIYYLVDNAPNFQINGYIKTTNNKYLDSILIDSMFIINDLPQFYLANDTTTCDSALISIQGGFTSYNWESGLSTIESVMIYTSDTLPVEVLNAVGCSTIDSIAVTINDSPTPNLFGDTTNCTQYGDVILSTDNFYSFYNWSQGSIDTNQISVNTSNLYTVSVTDTNGCTGSNDINVMFIDCVGLNEDIMMKPFLVNNQLYNYSETELVNLVVFDANGKQVLKRNKLESGEVLNLDYLKSGIYFLSFGQHRNQNLKFVIQP